MMKTADSHFMQNSNKGQVDLQHELTILEFHVIFDKNFLKTALSMFAPRSPMFLFRLTSGAMHSRPAS